MQKNGEGETGLLFTKSAYLYCHVMSINSYSLLVLNNCAPCLCLLCLFELSPCFTEEAAAVAASVLVVKGALVAVVKTGEITTDTSLNKKQLGILHACDARSLHFKCLFSFKF